MRTTRWRKTTDRYWKIYNAAWSRFQRCAWHDGHNAYVLLQRVLDAAEKYRYEGPVYALSLGSKFEIEKPGGRYWPPYWNDCNR
jgi:hypothetical protein